jgi:hypothetical protein
MISICILRYALKVTALSPSAEPITSCWDGPRLRPRKGFRLNIRGAKPSHFSLMLHLTMKMKISTVALAAMLFVGLSLTSSFAQVGISIGIAPPPIPIYEQPYAPAAGYIWTPGYWGYDSGYYWVPGVWVLRRESDSCGPRDTGATTAAITLQRGLLGPDRRVLRRDQLRLRLRGTGLLRRPMGRQYVPL